MSEQVVCPSHKVPLESLGSGLIGGVEVSYWGNCTGTIPGQTCSYHRDNPEGHLPAGVKCRCRMPTPCTREVRIEVAPGEQGDIFGDWHEQKAVNVSVARRP